MENFEIIFFFKAFIFRSKPLIVWFSPLLALLMLALGLPMEGTLLPLKWHALKNGLLKGPAFAFLLLNCLIVTIVASSKLEGEKRGHKEESKGLESRGQSNEGRCDERGLIVVNVAGELESHTAAQKGYDYPESIRKNEECFYQNISNNYCSEKSGLHEEVTNREPATGLIEKLENEKGDFIVVENVTKDGGSLYNETPLKNGYDVHSRNKGGSYPRRSRSLNAIKPYDYKPTHEQLKKNFVTEKKPIRSRDRLASRRNEKVRLHPNKPLLTSNLEKMQFNLITRDSLVSREAGSHPDQKPALQNSFDTTADEKCAQGLARAGNFVDHPAPAPAAMAHPSMAEVWAAICMQSNKRDGCTASNLQAEKRSNGEPSSQTAKKPQPAAVTVTPTQPIAPAAALAPPAADSRTLPPKAAAAAAISSRRAAKAALPKYPAEKPSVAAATEEGRELEELNRRAESFIARFNCQIRLQREESLQRQKRGRRTCNYERSHGLQLPPRGLLVG